MQFTTIITALSFALAATATPMVVERTEKTGQDVQNACSAKTPGSKASCCSQGILSLLGLPISILSPCNLIILGDILSNSCSGTAQTACCTGSTQNGVVNVGSVCSPISVNA